MSEIPVPEGFTKEQVEEFLSQQPKVFTTIEKSSTNQLRVQRTYYKGRELLGIQKFWRNSEDEDWQFGKAINFDYEDIPEIIEGLQKMQSFLSGGSNG